MFSYLCVWVAHESTKGIMRGEKETLCRVEESNKIHEMITLGREMVSKKGTEWEWKMRKDNYKGKTGG